MKTRLLPVLVAVILASCSTPKYTYKFDYHDYNAGRKQKLAAKEVASNPGPVELQPEMLVAEATIGVPNEATEAPVVSSKPVKSAPLTLSKSERKEMVKNVKGAIRNTIQAGKNADVIQTDQSTKAMDADLKMSIVFLVISILAGALITISELFWILSVAAFVVAAIFFIKWLMRQ